MSLTFAAAYALTLSTMALKPQIEPQQMQCLTEALYFEAGNQPYLGKIGVANVILERSTRTKKSICDVIRKPKQFSYRQMTAFKKQKIDLRNPKVKVAMLNAVTIALAAVKDHKKLPNIAGKGAEFYMNPVHATDFSWQKKFILTAKVGDHYFYRDPKRA